MALPVGVTTATCTVGVPVSFSGGPVRSNVAVKPSVFLVHTATGTPLVDMMESVYTSDGVAGQFVLPHTDQTGFQDENGNAYSNWYYTVTVQYSNDLQSMAPKTKVFQLVTGQVTVDLDKLPGGVPALPYIAPIATLTSFGGRTGAVTLQESDLPTRLSVGDLSATYDPIGAGTAAAAPKADKVDVVPKWKATTAYTAGDKVINPSGDIVTARVTFTSGASYSAANWIGSSTYDAPRKNILLGFGDSLVYYNFGDGAWQSLRPNPASRGQIMQANSMLGHRFDWINRGVGGEDTGAWLARLTTDLINIDAGYVYVSGPTNDVTNIDGGFRTVAQTKSAYNQIWDAAISTGKFIIQATAPPRDAATTNQKNLRSELNGWLRQQQGVRKNFVIADIERATMDPATNAFVTGYSWDGVHLATPGAVAAGLEIARKLDNIIPQRQITLPAADPRNLLKNNGGSFSGTASAVPTGWSAVGATGTDPTYDRVAHTDRPGQKFKLTVPNGTIRFYRSTTLQQSLSEFAPGDVVRFSIAYEVTGLDPAAGAITQALYATLERNGVNVAQDLEWSADANPQGGGTQNENMGSMARSGVLRTPTYTIPAGTGQTLAATFQTRGGGTYHFWNPTIEKVSP